MSGQISIPWNDHRLAAGGTALLVFSLVVAGCAEPAPAPDLAERVSGADRPRLLVLGTVQDGGLPHAGCACSHCERARNDHHPARLISSLAILLPDPREIHLIDATPDVRRQLDRARPHRPPSAAGVDRSPVDGVFLTHAHWGHYTGLGFFGFEAIHTRKLPVRCSPSMAEFLKINGPWSQLVEFGNIQLLPFENGRSIALGQGVSVVPIRVPHRDEYADTVGFVIEGPGRRVLYIPDTDSWRTWTPQLTQIIEGVDVAILDGTFYSAAELPGRDVSTIGHPLITDTMDLLEPLLRERGLSVYFTHLNHSNPALFADTPERREIERRGFEVLSESQQIPL
jgi:pyrroloquinoline quinone biosynthesis protein B